MTHQGKKKKTSARSLALTLMLVLTLNKAAQRIQEERRRAAALLDREADKESPQHPKLGNLSPSPLPDPNPNKLDCAL